MKLRNTLILLAVAAGLVLFIVIFERGRKSREELLELEKYAFPELKDRTDDATAVEIVRGPEKLVLVKREAGTDDEHWQITQPIDYRADRSRVDGFLGAFEGAEKAVVDAEGAHEIPLEPGDPVTEYKLDKESAVLVTVYADKEKLLDALVGTLTAAKDKVYVAHASREAVYVVGDVVNDEARRIVDEFRDKRLLTLKSRGQVTGLTLMEEEKPKAVLTRRKGEPWHLTAPLADRAAQDKVREIVDKMDSLWADTFIADFGPDDPEMSEKMAGYGLVPAKRSVKIALESGGQVSTHEVLFGKKIKKHETGSSPSHDVYAMVAGTRTVALIPAGSLDPLDVSVDDLRDRDVVDFETSDAVALVIDRPGGELLLEKKDDDWRMLIPDERGADKTKVRDLLDALRDLKVEKFLPAGTELKTPVRVEVSCKVKDDDAPSGEDADGGEAVKLEKHVAFFEQGDGDTIRARRGEKGAVFEVKRAILETLAAPPLAFRDRRVVEFDTGKLAMLAVTVDGKTDVAKREDGKWKLDGDGEVDELRADRIKWDLSELECEEFVGKATDAELAKYGLAPAAVRVQITLKPEEEGKAGRTHVLLVGKASNPEAAEDERKYYARLADDPLVFLLDANALKDVRLGLVKKMAETAPAPGGAEAADDSPATDAAEAEKE
ncbi:MAG: DUF4340 domain-containing protein [Planctomycetota bacterium]|jgi:hypothetical protein